MGIVLGFVCIFLFLLLCAKALTRKFHLKRADAFLFKLHKPVSVLLILVCLFHIIAVLPVIKTRHILLTVSGICAIFFMILLIILCHKAKPKALKLRLHRIFAFLMALAIIFHIGIYYIDFAAYQDKIATVSIEEINFSQIKDGTYIGEYDAGYIYAKVQVTIDDGAMTDLILLEHRNERGKPAEAILPEIINRQSLTVDTISGATNSSLVIKAAIQKALQNSQTR